VIKIITGIGDPLSGQLFLFDAQDFSARKVKVSKNKNNPLTGENPEITELIDYEAFCGVPSTNGEQKKGSEVPEISVEEFKSWLDAGEDVQLIDVREPYEVEIANIGGELIPLDQVLNEADKISRDKKVVVHCRSGQRSADAIKKLQEEYDFDNLYNLKGGILAWSEEIDDSVPQY